MEPTQELRRLKEFMKEVGTQLSILEKHLYEFETEYLETTAGYGNLVAGFEGFQDSKPRQSVMVKKARIADRDRVFTNSSVSAEMLLSKASKLGSAFKKKLSGKPLGRAPTLLHQMDGGTSGGSDVEASPMQGAESGGGALLDIPEFTLEESRRGGGVEGRRGAPNASAGTKAGPSTSSHKRKKHRANSEASFDDEAEM